jgi:glycosyltransferase involved in cell wall biosynthesis
MPLPHGLGRLLPKAINSSKEERSGTRILHLLMSDYRIDSRVRNETESLKKSGFEVDVFCLRSGVTTKAEVRNGVNIARFGIYPGHKMVHILTAYFGFFYVAMGKNYRLVHAHDFTALPIGFLLSRLKKIPLIYDTHELWSESEHEEYPKRALAIAYRVEKHIARKADRIVTVSDSINNFLRQYFKHPRITTTRNIPSYTSPHPSSILRERFSIPAKVPIFIYQGAISKARGVDTLLQAVKKIGNMDFKFLLLGNGPYVGEIQEFIRDNQLESKILISAEVPQDELIKILSSGDVGVHAISNTCLNHQYCLPNKLFEYIHAGLCILCTHLKEMAQLVQKKELGLTFADHDSDDLALKMRYLIEHRDEMNRYKSNSKRLNQCLTWDNEFVGIKNIYDELLHPGKQLEPQKSFEFPHWPGPV